MKFKKVLFLSLIFIFSGINFAFSQEEESEPTLDELLAEKPSKDSPNPSIQHELNIITSGSSVEMLDLDPKTASYNSEAQILNGLYEGLFVYEPKTLEPVPAIAESHKISKDKKKWTFKIRPGLKFSDGTPITAQSVKDSWMMLLKTPDAPYASLLDPIVNVENFRKGKALEKDVGITCRDELTLVVNLRSPTAHFSRILCHHAFSVFKEDLSVFSGAYVISSRDKEKLILKKNDMYWDAKKVNIPSIKITCSYDEKENTWHFNTGRTDWIIGSVDPNTLLNPKSMRFSAIFGTAYMFFSCKNKPWDDPDFRNALLTAVPWDELRKPFLIPAKTLVYPLSGYASPEGLDETSEEDALEMMEEAKKKAGMKPEEKLTLVFAISKESEMQKKQAEILKKAWAKIGVELQIQTSPDERYINSIANWNADIFYYSWIGDYADPSAFLELFREGSTLNQTNWINKKFSETLTKSDETTNPVERYKLLAQAEEILLNDGVIIPYSHSVCLHALNLNCIGGWYTNALDIHPFKSIFFKEDLTSSAPTVAIR